MNTNRTEEAINQNRRRLLGSGTMGIAVAGTATRDEMLDDVALYWLTNTGTPSSRSYWDAAKGGGRPFNAAEMTKIPVAVSVFPGKIYRAPQNWAEQSFRKLIYWNEVSKGGHFAAWEQPEFCSAEMRAAFRSLRKAS